MTDRDKHGETIRELAESNPQPRQAIREHAKEVFRKAREEGMDRGQAEELLDKVLAGMEEGLREAGLETRLILIETIDAFIFVFGDILAQTEEALSSYAEDLKAFVSRAVEAGETLRAALKKRRRPDGKD